MSEEEKMSIFSAPEFLDFVEHSTKIIQRALNDNYDYIRDYTIGTESGVCVSVLIMACAGTECSVGKLLRGRLSAYARSTTKDTERTGQSRISTGHPRLTHILHSDRLLLTNRVVS